MEGNKVENKSNQNKRLGDLLKELVTVQTQKILMSTAINIRKIRNIVAEKLRPFKEGYLRDKKASEQVKQYETTIKEMQQNYEDGWQDIESERAKLELEEEDAIVELNKKINDKTIAQKKFEDLTRQKNELTSQENNLVARRESLKKAGKKQEARKVQNDIDKKREEIGRVTIQVQAAEKRWKECREAARQANQNWKEIKRKIKENQRKEKEYEEEGMDLFQGIKTLDKRKEEVSLIPKQNTLQKILGWIAYRVSKTEKFSVDLLKNLQKETQRLRQRNIKIGEGERTARPSLLEIVKRNQIAKNKIVERVSQDGEVTNTQTGSEANRQSIEEQVWGHEVIPQEESFL